MTITTSTSSSSQRKEVKKPGGIPDEGSLQGGLLTGGGSLLQIGGGGGMGGRGGGGRGGGQRPQSAGSSSYSGYQRSKNDANEEEGKGEDYDYDYEGQMISYKQPSGRRKKGTKQGFMHPMIGTTNPVEVLIRKDGLTYSLDTIINSLFQLKKGYENLDAKIEEVKTCITENVSEIFEETSI